MTPSLRRTQLNDEVAAYLREQIMTGELRRGEFVRLDDMASRLGCSVTPVREALVTLRGEGLVRSSPHRGFVVEPLNRRDIVDIFWMQAQLSARLAIHAASNENLQSNLSDLDELIDAFEDAVQHGEAAKIQAAEFAFHRKVNLMADSKKLAWFLYSASRYTPNNVFASDPEWGTQAVASHRRLVSYFRSGDHDAINREIHARFDDARDRLLVQLESIDFFGDAAPHSNSA